MKGKIQQLAIKELRESLHDTYFYAIAFIVFALFVFSLSLNSITFRNAAQIRKIAQERVRRQWLNQGEVGPHGAAHYGITAFREFSPLSIIDRGTMDYTGRSITLETHKRNAADHTLARDHNSLLRFGYFTPAFILQYFFPLVIIILSYSSITSEKENNTLRMLLSNALSGKQILTGKLLGIFYKLLIIYLPVVALFLGFVVWPQALPTDHSLSLWLLCLAYLVYFMIFALITVSVSSYCNTSRKSLLISLCIWISVCIFIPRLAVFIAGSAVPTPSTYRYSRELEAKYKYDFSEVYKNIEQALVNAEGVASAEDLSVNPFGYALEETEERGQKVYESVYGNIESKFHQQDATARFTGLLSPLYSLREISMELCWTGTQEQIHFGQQAEEYRRKMMYTLNMDIAHHSPYEEHDFVKKKITYAQDKTLWEMVPDYKYIFLSLGTILSNQKSSLFLLTGWLIASLILARYSYKKITI